MIKNSFLLFQWTEDLEHGGHGGHVQSHVGEDERQRHELVIAPHPPTGENIVKVGLRPRLHAILRPAQVNHLNLKRLVHILWGSNTHMRRLGL